MIRYEIQFSKKRASVGHEDTLDEAITWVQRCLTAGMDPFTEARFYDRSTFERDVMNAKPIRTLKLSDFNQEISE